MTTDEGFRRARPAPSGRGVTATLAGMLAIVALTWLLSLVVVVPLAYGLGLWLVHDGRAPLLIGVLGWTVSAGLVLLRPVESRFARLLFRVRRPSEQELARLLPVWRRACGRVGVDPDAFTLRIEDRQAVNAFALGAHFVAVTGRALELPDELLEAVLAHELGHHRDLHPLAATLGWWYLLPFSLLSLVLRRVRAATRATSRGFSALRQRIGQSSGGRPLEGPLGLVVGVAAAVGGAVTLLGVRGRPTRRRARLRRRPHPRPRAVRGRRAARAAPGRPGRAARLPPQLPCAHPGGAAPRRLIARAYRRAARYLGSMSPHSFARLGHLPRR